jgi:hypothetical protein
MSNDGMMLMLWRSFYRPPNQPMRRFALTLGCLIVIVAAVIFLRVQAERPTSR